MRHGVFEHTAMMFYAAVTNVAAITPIIYYIVKLRMFVYFSLFLIKVCY
jgi:hypothetical protein